MPWYNESPPQWLYTVAFVFGVIAIILGAIGWFV